MAEKCIVSIKEEQPQQPEECPSPLGADLITSCGVVGSATVVVSASSTPTQQFGCGGDLLLDGSVNRRHWVYSIGGADEEQQQNPSLLVETPAIEEKVNGLVGKAKAATTATTTPTKPVTKPKRLSDEFYSADDDYDEEEEDDQEDEDDEMLGGKVGGGSSVIGTGSGLSGGRSGGSSTDGDCEEAHAGLNEIKNLSITNSSSSNSSNNGGEGGEGNGVDENSISDPIYISEETSSCSSGHQRQQQQRLGVVEESSSERAAETERQQDQQQKQQQHIAMEQEEEELPEGVAVLEDELGEEDDVDAEDEDDDEDEEDVDEEDLHDDVQSIDAIERRDFELEQKLTGGIIIKNSAFRPDNHRLNLGLMIRNNRIREGGDALGPASPRADGKMQLTTTPTSSRNAYRSSGSSSNSNPSSSNSTSNREQNSNSTTTAKSAVKVNLSASLESYCAAEAAAEVDGGPSCSSSMASSSSSSSASSSNGSSKALRRQQQLDAIFNSNSNDSLSSDRSIFIPNLQALKTSSSVVVKDCQSSTPASNDCSRNEPGTSSSSSSSPSPSSSSAGPSGMSAGSATATTKPPSDCSLQSSCATSVIRQTGECSKNINHHPTPPILPSTSTSSSSLFSFSCSNHPIDHDRDEVIVGGEACSSVAPFGESIADEELPQPSGSSSSNSIRQHIADDPLLESSHQLPTLPLELAAAAAAAAAAASIEHHHHSHHHECDEDNWADCEEGSDEEVCTCRDYTDDDEGHGGNTSTTGGGHAVSASEDELPSRDVDLSSYTHMDAAEDILAHDPSSATAANTSGASAPSNTSTANGGSGTGAGANSNNAQTPRLHRKRKLTENRILFASGGGGTSTGANRSSADRTGSGDHTQLHLRVVGGGGDSPSSESLNFSSRKRLALDSSSSSSSPRTTAALLSPSNLTSTPTSSSLGERKTPRSIIPTKDNPPPELNEWLMQFQRWTPVERLVAMDLLIDHCEPSQVRHIMKTIEPQFQRDFISLLPKELALQVLSYLDPKDLLRAAQTCRSWRFLADDNLLWKEKCKEAAILMDATGGDRPKRGRAGNMPPISSPWKAAYMRQHIIEMNWRSRPIRTPKVLKGHDDHVITCLQFCGHRIVSGSDDNTLKVWSAITGKCLRTLVGHTGGVWSSQMSEELIISGSTDRTLKVWDVESGALKHTLYGHTSTVRCMHLHDKKVVSGSRDATLRVWDVERGTCLHVLVGHLAAVRCVQYDGRLVVSGAYDYMVKVWNPERQECLHTLQGHTNRVYSLQFDGIHVVSGSLDTSIRVWDAETGSCKHALMGHQSLTSGMELRQNILVSGNADSTVKVWDIITGQCLQTLSGPNKHQSAVTCLQFNSRFVITSSDDGTVKLWDVKTGEFIRNLVALESGGSGGVVWRIRANDTKLICAVGSRNGTEETKLMVLDFDVEGACLKCS